MIDNNTREDYTTKFHSSFNIYEQSKQSEQPHLSPNKDATILYLQ